VESRDWNDNKSVKIAIGLVVGYYSSNSFSVNIGFVKGLFTISVSFTYTHFSSYKIEREPKFEYECKCE
jgi:hypothetical protein